MLVVLADQVSFIITVFGQKIRGGIPSSEIFKTYSPNTVNTTSGTIISYQFLPHELNLYTLL